MNQTLQELKAEWLDELLEKAYEAEKADGFFPSNQMLRKVYAIESEEALKLCRQMGLPVPRSAL